MGGQAFCLICEFVPNVGEPVNANECEAVLLHTSPFCSLVWLCVYIAKVIAKNWHQAYVCKFYDYV